MEPTIRLFVVTHKKRTHVYSLQTLQMAKESLVPEAFALLETSGEWKEIWLHEALARHEQDIQSRCIVRNELAGFRYDSSKEPGVRCAVMVEKWNGFPKAPSEEAYNDLPLSLAKAVDAAILEHMYPSGLDADFFQSVSKS